MDLHRSSTIILLILSILSPATLSMRYELLSGHTKCISEEIHANAMSVGKYSIVNPHEDHPLPASHKITVKNMESEVKKLFDTVTSIHDEMFYLRDREEEMHELNISTNSKMAWLSFLSLGVCLSVAGLQFWHLKTFFEKKKLI